MNITHNTQIIKTRKLNVTTSQYKQIPARKPAVENNIYIYIYINDICV